MNRKIETLKRQWQSYVLNNKLDPNTKPFVKEAWDRCLAKGVDYNSGYGQVISKQALNKKLKENQRLISVAKPVMESIYEVIKETSFSLILTDADGVLIHVVQCDSIQPKHNTLNFVLGTRWDEENVGANAIGTALARNKDTHMKGAEHFCISHHPWTCAAALIHNANGELIGCLDISGSVEDDHIHTFGIVTSAVKIIEKQLDLMANYELIDNAFNSVLDGLVSIDKDFKVLRMNKKMIDILGISSQEVNQLNMKDIFKDIDIENEVFIKGQNVKRSDYFINFQGKKLECLLNISPTKVNKQITGAVIFVKEAVQVRKVVSQIAGYRASYSFNDILTNNKTMKQMITFAKRISKTNSNILIQGESGTGKELVAHSIHNHSQRKNNPFIALNCAALPKDLFESELFGYEKGSFTGALKEGKPGKFELASGGTIFLDEIGELPYEIQSKLLRVIENNKISRIGSTHQRTIDVRILAATNRNIQKEIENKNFREDLYYRLDEINIYTTPLRDRPEDIILLAEYFLQELNQKNEHADKNFTESFKRQLLKKQWNGNVRELRNYIRKGYYVSTGNTIDVYESLAYHQQQTNENIDIREKSLAAIEKETITKALGLTDGNVVKAAKQLGIGKSTLYRKIKKYNLTL